MIMTIKKRTARQIGKSNSRNSKSHERKVAELLTEWCEKHGSDYRFKRRSKEGRDEDSISIFATGDVIPTKGQCKFNIEAKKHENFSFTSVITNPTGCMLSKFWHQSTYDSQLQSAIRKVKVYPIVFFKPSKMIHWIIISPCGYEQLDLLDGQIRYDFPHFKFSFFDDKLIAHNVKRSGQSHCVSLELSTCILTDWKVFKEHVNPHSFMYV